MQIAFFHSTGNSPNDESMADTRSRFSDAVAGSQKTGFLSLEHRFKRRRLTPLPVRSNGISRMREARRKRFRFAHNPGSLVEASRWKSRDLVDETHHTEGVEGFVSICPTDIWRHMVTVTCDLGTLYCGAPNSELRPPLGLFRIEYHQI